MRRFLVLTDETARHPFRASLPPHVLAGVRPRPVPRGPERLTRTDLRLLGSAYLATLLAVSLFLI